MTGNSSPHSRQDSTRSRGLARVGGPQIEPRVGRIRFRNTKRILMAAEEVFSERGYEGATTALIAKRAGLPKANMHYYFPTKLHVYKAVIESILELWLSAFDSIRPDDNPAEALSKYIHAKMDYSRSRPFASRVFANEIISGAPVIRQFLSKDLRNWVREKSGIFRSWAQAGKMLPLAQPEHLFFIIWAATQTYADFSTQMCAVLGRKKLKDEDYDNGAKLLTNLVLAGCGIIPGMPSREYAVSVVKAAYSDEMSVRRSLAEKPPARSKLRNTNRLKRTRKLPKK